MRAVLILFSLSSLHAQILQGIFADTPVSAGVTPISQLSAPNGYVACGNGSNGCTTASVNSTGATLIVGIDCTYTAGPGFGFADNQSNTYATLGIYTSSDNDQCRLFYANASTTATFTTGPGHTFHDLGTGSFAGVGVLLFSNTTTAAPVVALSDKGSTSGSCSAIALCQPGSVTVSVGNVEVAFFTVAFGNTYTGILLTDTDFVIDGSIHSGSEEGFTLAHLIPTSTAARNPSWCPWNGVSTPSCNISDPAAFAVASFAHQ